MVPVPTRRLLSRSIYPVCLFLSFNYERLVFYITPQNEEQNLQNFFGDILSLDFCVCELFVFNESQYLNNRVHFRSSVCVLATESGSYSLRHELGLEQLCGS